MCFLCCVLVNESCPGRHGVRLRLLPQRWDKAKAQGSGALTVSDRLTPLLDAAARLPAETIATGRNRIFLCDLCLQLPCVVTAARAAVSRGKHCPFPKKHAIVKGVVIVIRAVVCRRTYVAAHSF